MQEASIQVQGMTCRSCIQKIEGALDPMVVEGKVHFDQGTVQVTYDESKTKLADIKDVIRGKGYTVID
ncbi:cation transporter [Paenibacillus motobuensis]|uniref:HMA domain-containing protein n=1 Tax=Paenibacillus motobuensis TaxID=295324 RepID=A0ABP3I5H7_9BACL